MDKRVQKRFRREHRPKSRGGVQTSLIQPSDGWRLVKRADSPEDARKIVERSEALHGTPFERLPGDPPQKAVVANLADGTELTAEMVEMVFNDAWFIDATQAVKGIYAALAGAREAEILLIARGLYGREYAHPIPCPCKEYAA